MITIHKKQQRQSNNHARSKQKRRALRLKNRMNSIQAKRSEKIQKSYKNKIRPFVATPDIRAKDVAVYQDCGQFYDFKHTKNLNQRQKRKRWAQTNQRNKKV